MLNKINPVIWLILIPLLIPFVEVGTTIFLTKTLGAVVTYSLFAASNIIGLVVLWFRWKKVKLYVDEIRAMEFSEEDKTQGRILDPETQERMTVVGKFLLSVVLLLIPGFVTDLVAFYLTFLMRKTNNSASQTNPGDL